MREINNAFLSLIEKLQKSAEVASPIQSFTRDQSVLAYYSFGAGSGGEWCRANLTFDQCPKEDYVWVSFIDYGHKAMVPRKVIRVLEESLRREPVYLLTVSFKRKLSAQDSADVTEIEWSGDEKRQVRISIRDRNSCILSF